MLSNMKLDILFLYHVFIALGHHQVDASLVISKELLSRIRTLLYHQLFLNSHFLRIQSYIKTQQA